ncbi:MAG: Mut7-C RNAse domain-containing protein [Moorellales bacterium]
MPNQLSKTAADHTCTFRFYAELNDFLPPERRQVPFQHFFFGRPAVKDLIESLGVPHTEVDLILVNGGSVDFSYRVRDGDLISVYPVFESLDISSVTRVRAQPLRRPRFVLDGHLGRLAAYLRLLGFDSLYRGNLPDAILAGISVQDRRILLTRDRGLLKRSQVSHGYLVRETNPRQQITEVVRRFDLWGLARPFSRCMRCNEELVAVRKEEILDRLPPRVREGCEEFRKCPGCDRVYWKGSHYERLARLVREVLEEESTPKP